MLICIAIPAAAISACFDWNLVTSCRSCFIRNFTWQYRLGNSDRSKDLNPCLTSLKIPPMVLYQIHNRAPWSLVLGQPSHVLDLWCEGKPMGCTSLVRTETYFTAIRNRDQCRFMDKFSDQSQPFPSQLRSKLPFRHYSFRLDPFAATRIGEAANPGPESVDSEESFATPVTREPLRLTFAVTNPTLIYQKSKLPLNLGVDTIMLSETAATSTVQSIETGNFRRNGYTSIWGQPMMPHHHHAPEGSLKGAAAGVSNHSRYPIRVPRVPQDSEWYQAGRILKTFLRLPKHEIQLITAYGYPANHPSARLKTNQLLQFAVDQAFQTTFPTIICGDFNHHPDDLEALQPLWNRGYQTAESIYRKLTGQMLPPTFQVSTRNDVAIFSPELAALITAVWVDEQHLIANHNPLCFSMTIPDKPLHQQTWKLPHTWLHLHPKTHLIEKHFQPPEFTQQECSLETWSKAVENAVHAALKEEILASPTGQYPGLPKKCRGRCKTPKIVKNPMPRSIRPAWQGHYQPAVDQPSMRIVQLTKQIRRLQSLRQRVHKWETNPTLPSIYWEQLWEEWQCILRAPGFPGGFSRWIQKHPEVFMLPLHLPDEDMIYQIEQLLRFHVDGLVYEHKRKQQALAQFKRQQDVKKYGRAQAFQSVKDAGAGLLTQIQQEKQWPVIVKQPLQYGLITVTLPQDACLDSFQDLRLNNHPVEFVQWNAPDLELMVHDADVVLDPDTHLSQPQTTARPTDVAAQLDDHWRQYWDRDKHVPPATWDILNGLINNLPSHATITDDLFDLKTWKNAIHALKSKTARGCCAWAADELKQLQDNCVTSLIQAFQFLGHAGMPKHLMAARTVPLLKKPEAMSPKDTRPITILSLLYRLWGRVMTQVVLSKWNQFFPPAVTGFLPGRSAIMPMYKLQLHLERAHQDATQQWSGLTLDIRKCFNSLPVSPVPTLLQKLGVPTLIIEFWANSHSNINRCWQVANQIFATGPQSTGVPEGDSMSVLIMLAYNYMWTIAIPASRTLANAYADNWSYATPDVTQHIQILQPILALVDAMHLEIDWEKTWVWVTHPDLKTQLQDLLQHLLPAGIQVDCALHARDLGFILHYRRKQFRKPQKDRHAKALRTLRKLQRSPLDRNTKALIAQTAIVKSLYGGHTHVTGEHFFRELRTEVARALVGPHQNVNSFLACMTLSKMVMDPELYLIRQALRFAREYLLYATPDEATLFLEFAALRQHNAKKVTGPCGALAIYLEKLDWKLTQDGSLLVSAFYTLHLLHTPWQVLWNALEHSWMTHLSLQLTSRKGYGAIPVIDRKATLAMFSSIPEPQQKTAAYAITGGFMLQHQKSKFDDGQSDLCSYCEIELDDHEHRVLRCTTTEPIRANYASTCEYLAEHDPIHVICPVMFVDPAWELHRQIWTQMPEPMLTLPHEAYHGPIFTDGSCQFPENVRYRFAANAAVCFRHDAPPDHELRLLSPDDLLTKGFHVIACSMLQGPQSIARAELQIVVKLIEAKVPGPIITDSQYVLLTQALVHSTLDVRTLHMRPNSDLLFRWHVMYHVHAVCPDVQKVKSHMPLQTCHDPDLLHLRLGNAAAD